MNDLREYKDLIRSQVKKVDELDANWKWSVKSITKSKIRIRWGYLDYLEEKNNCFIINLECNKYSGTWLWACKPDEKGIECYMVTEGTPNPRIGAEQTLKSAIVDAIDEIAHYALSRY